MSSYFTNEGKTFWRRHNKGNKDRTYSVWIIGRLTVQASEATRTMVVGVHCRHIVLYSTENFRAPESR